MSDWLLLTLWLSCGAAGAVFLKPTESAVFLAVVLGPITVLLALLDWWVDHD